MKHIPATQYLFRAGSILSLSSNTHLSLCEHLSHKSVVLMANVFAMSVPPKTEPVGPRAPKEDFMKALGLTVNDPADEKTYRSMRVWDILLSSRKSRTDRLQEFAIAMYTRLNEDRRSLISDKKSD